MLETRGEVCDREVASLNPGKGGGSVTGDKAGIQSKTPTV